AEWASRRDAAEQPVDARLDRTAGAQDGLLPHDEVHQARDELVDMRRFRVGATEPLPDNTAKLAFDRIMILATLRGDLFRQRRHRFAEAAAALRVHVRIDRLAIDTPRFVGQIRAGLHAGDALADAVAELGEPRVAIAHRGVRDLA